MYIRRFVGCLEKMLYKRSYQIISVFIYNVSIMIILHFVEFFFLKCREFFVENIAYNKNKSCGTFSNFKTNIYIFGNICAILTQRHCVGPIKSSIKIADYFRLFMIQDDSKRYFSYSIFC